ncbi:MULTISPECIES: efflux RND transporter permease subunit [Methylobacterium]|jgi:cobalt-zinc-cadmium resistance protein CzcA|uniref:CusA/CzcA family heavy metal efflux RND transporter n=1 Tax=Methylobacterium currus TaxID=2051553 RepID=A0A2R4WX63_9HYPH|nr:MULTISPECIES: CusA/CzcA family heavy metal efflux RND transporter [Methylobacterium]MBZ6415581.1 CusA/CzcA family heavy metal efflux RND transporter [Methylobacterium sp.]AWB26128.1 CusA/CzcA family heavy metal efflux RND transporter [Methylobacterium currus]MBK3399733.1 CusA/CzcA family heavy metal efflux RND transporter [Methylobacterium ajmalii]MBK3410799.1 CusA/CzcA family heavy metal efflux RND transporter [Methylobacterium ajmalii]MBK3422275.1 CusA/CzcA family heavy metal efflux RND t
MISRILDFSVHQRWLVVLLSLLAAGFGVFSLTKLPIDAVPDITNNQVQINTVAPSYSPVDIEKQVTYPVETALAGIKGLEYTRSLSRNGFSQVTAVFAEKLDIYFARQQVGERLSQAKASLPPGAEPQMGPISTGLGEIYMWSVHYAKPGEGAPIVDGKPGWQSDGSYLTPEGQRLTTELERSAYLRTIQDWIIRLQIKTVPGVAGVDGIGGYEKQYHVQPDPMKLASLDLSFADVARALEANNANQGARYLEENGEGYVVRAAGRLESMEEIGTVVVTTRGGVPVRIKDIAQVRIGRDLRTGSGSEDGREVVIGTALMLIGENSRTVAAAVDAKMNEIRRSLPPGVAVQTVLNRTLLVEATIKTVAKNLAEGAALVIVILFLLLGNIRAAIITALVIPVAMLMTMTGMVEARISANLMSLGALDFGLIVDGAVIITENALRHLAEKQAELGRKLDLEERLATVRASAEEMIKPSLFGQAIIILVYVPLLTFTGVEGKMFEPMALTVIIALVSAFVLSLTFVPAMIAIVITGKVTEKDNLIIRAFKAAYRPALGAAVRAPLVFISAALLLLAGAGVLFTRLGAEFIPTLDEKSIAMNALRIPSTSLSQSQAMQLKIEQAVSKFPQVAYVFSKTGTAEVASDPMPQNSSDTFVILKPQEEWPDPELSKAELQEQIEKAVGGLAGNVLEFSQPIQLRFNELLAGTRGDLAVKVFGEEFEPMTRVANQIAAILRGTPGAEDVKVEQTAGLPFLEIKIDKIGAARLGLSTSAIQEVIGAAIGGKEAGMVFEGDRRFPIVVRLTDKVREDREALENLPVSLPPGPNGRAASVLLKQVASFTVSEGPNQISRENGKRRVVVTANVRGRDIGSLVAEAQAKVGSEVQLPSGYSVSWGGQFENLASARQRLMIVVPVCFFLIFLLLYSALGSPRDALLVFSAVPLALTGGIAALWLRGMPFSVPAAVGFIALSGVAVLNGLVMLTFIKQLIAEGRPKAEAIYEGAMTRLRPVAMTALVASLGFVPMALATETGAEIQRPLATVVIGGLISATLLTLLVLPALYARFGGVQTPTAPRREEDAGAVRRPLRQAAE